MKINTCELRGNIATDIELKETKTGKKYVSFNLAVKKNKKSKEDVYFFRINAFNTMAEILTNYYQKGDLVRIEGHLQVSQYEKEGIKIYSTDIVCEDCERIMYRTKDEAAEIAAKKEELAAQAEKINNETGEIIDSEDTDTSEEFDEDGF